MSRVRGQPPGRAGLMWLQHRLGLAHRAASRLDQKLKILRTEQAAFALLLERSGLAWEQASRDAEAWLLRAAMLGGQDGIRPPAGQPPAEVSITWTSALGNQLPLARELHHAGARPGHRQRLAGSSGRGLRGLSPGAPGRGGARRGDHRLAGHRRRGDDDPATTTGGAGPLGPATGGRPRGAAPEPRRDRARRARAPAMGRRPRSVRAMTQRILVAADDSPAGLEAARWAVDLAERYAAALRVLHVLADSHVTEALAASGSPGLAERRREAVRSLFRHVSALAATAGVAAETVELYGEPAARILEQARAWPADLVVIGRGAPRGAGGPWVGQGDPDGAGVRRAAGPRRPPARPQTRGEDLRHSRCRLVMVIVEQSTVTGSRSRGGS